MANALEEAVRDLCGDGSESAPQCDLVSARAVLDDAWDRFFTYIKLVTCRVEKVRAVQWRKGLSRELFEGRLEVIDAAILAAFEQVEAIEEQPANPTAKEVNGICWALSGRVAKLESIVVFCEEIARGANQIAGQSKPRQRMYSRAEKIEATARALEFYEIDESLPKAQRALRLARTLDREKDPDCWPELFNEAESSYLSPRSLERYVPDPLGQKAHRS